MLKVEETHYNEIGETLIYILKAIQRAIVDEDTEYIKFLLGIYKELLPKPIIGEMDL